MSSTEFSTVARPIVIAHRGASGHALENSIAAFRIAAEAGLAHADGVELDVHTTSDAQFVVHHDATLATGEQIAAIPLSRVRASNLADGSPIPTLEEAIAALRGIELFVEAKGLPATADGALIEQLRAHRGAAHHVHAFDHRIIARLRQVDRNISLGVLSSSYPVDPTEPVKVAGATTLWQQADLIDAALVAKCHDAGIAIIAWTVNDRDEARKLAELGVDGLCGNWPDRLRGLG